MMSLKTHNQLDYFLGGLFLITPWLFGMSAVPAARNLFLLMGAGLILYSLLTNYYLAITRVIPLGVHMTLDACLGVVLILAPALFGYRDTITDSQYAVHVIMGLGAVGLVSLTRPRSEAAKSPAERAAIARDDFLPH